MAPSGDQQTEDTHVVIVAFDEGEVYCLADEDGEPQIYAQDDPELPGLLETAAAKFDADVRALPIDEFMALGEDGK